MGQEARGKRKGGGKRLELAACHLVLVILALALLWPVVRHPGWWIWSPGAEHSDLAVTHWPNTHFTRQVLWGDGQFPLWRPTIMSGTPFAANPLAGLYYPPNWLFLFLPWLPLEVGFNLSALAHLWLAGAAMVTLMRRGLGATTWGALVAAVAYEASPKLLAHLGAGHVGWVQAWGWLPVVVLCWLKMLREQEAGSRRQEAGSRRQEAGSRRQEAGSRRQEAGGRRQEAGSGKQEAGGRKQEVGSRRKFAVCNLQFAIRNFRRSGAGDAVLCRRPDGRVHDRRGVLVAGGPLLDAGY